MTRTIVYFTDGSTFGGAEQMLLTLLAGLDRDHWNPILMYHPEPDLEPFARQAAALNVTQQVVPRLHQGKRTATQIARFVRELRSHSPAVFHAHLNWPLSCEYALLGAALARIPAIVATQHLFAEIPWRWHSRYFQRLVGLGVDRYIAVSNDVAREMCRTLRIPDGKVRMIHNGIDPDRFDRTADPHLRATLSGGTDRPLVFTSARLVQQKGHRYLLEAAASVPEAVFVLAGEGPERRNLEEQIRSTDLDARVVLLGHRDDIPDLLAVCDLFVLPSLYEGLPVVVLEAMAAGKPVIATAVGGTSEAVVYGQTGLLVPPADPAALSRAIRMLLDNTEMGRRLARAGRCRVYRDFAAPTMVRRVTDVYDEILSAAGAADG